MGMIDKNVEANILILLADMPLISATSLKDLMNKQDLKSDVNISILAAEFPKDNIPDFGRMVLDNNQLLEEIIEHKDASNEQKDINLCNTGAIFIEAQTLKEYVHKITNQNAQNEFYLTDLPKIAAKNGIRTSISVLNDYRESMGVNSREDLCKMEEYVQEITRKNAVDSGVTLIMPETIYISKGAEFGQDVVIEPHVYIGKDVKIGHNVHIKSFSYIEGANIDEGAVIGPFARIRPQSTIGKNCKIGNFVEIKNSQLEEGVKASHLAYIGDSDVGAQTNFSCGAITVNYDGISKYRSSIGKNVMIGSNVNLIAPIKIHDGAFVAAGSTITKDIPPDTLAVAREKLFLKEGWAKNRSKKAS
jgi:bifunctional UDP-N-acetylglucosamine pyrophosphorylase/glucosamine-1-phosphate N-acetyltransferase